MLNKTLYKLDSKGKQRQWTISLEGNELSEVVNIVIVAGLVTGGKVETKIPISSGKNLGKANATTPYEQARLEAFAKYALQIRSGYVDDIDNAKQATLASGISAPMLAQKYHPTGAQKGSKTLDKMKIRGKKIHVQPKYDGTRCLIKVNGGGVELYTRKGDRMLPIPHIEEQILQSYAKIQWYEEAEELILDGELFTNEFSFNTLNGLLRKEDKSEEQLDQLLKVNYHIYDTYSELGYARRYEIIRNFISNNVKLVPSYEIIATDENIKAKLEEFLAEGHEGLMIRTLNTGYENKRSWSLVKVKLFEDAEFEVVDLEQDSIGRLGKFIMKAPAGLTDRDGKTIETFKAGITGISHEEGYQILRNKSEYIGKMATIEFFGVSEYGVPRFPKFKGLRND